MIFAKFTGKVVCLIYSLSFVTIIGLGPVYCMNDDSFLQKCKSFIKRKMEVQEAKRNGEVVQFIKEVIPPSLVITVEDITEEKDEFVMLLSQQQRINITLSNPTPKDEKTIRTYHKSGSSYDSLHLTFKEREHFFEEQENYPSGTQRMCFAATSAICPGIKEFVFEGPFMEKALLMIWKHCPHIETLSLTSQNLPEILEELCTVDAEKLEKLTDVLLIGESSPELLTKLRNSFSTITSVEVKENAMVEKDL